jgi:hypothetical protein
VKWLGKGMFIATGVYQGVLEMGSFPNEKYSKIMQNSRNFHSYPLILIPKWSIC